MAKAEGWSPGYISIILYNYPLLSRGLVTCSSSQCVSPVKSPATLWDNHLGPFLCHGDHDQANLALNDVYGLCRLHTIIDCDMVLVMDHGQAAEWGSPASLLDNPEGVFFSMVKDTCRLLNPKPFCSV